MTESAYPFHISNDALNYTFDSISELKIIHKRAEFRSFPDNPIFYNLALLDFHDDGRVDDLVVSNNHDMKRILATVFQAMLTFFNTYPNKLVYFKGNDGAGLRSRLYRILIARELDQAQKLFEIYGQLPNNTYEEFCLTDPTLLSFFN